MRKPRIFCTELSSSSYKCTNIKQIHHLAKVLRLKPGDAVELFDGNGSVANGKIQEINKAYITFAIGDILVKEHPYQKFYQAIIPYLKRIPKEFMREFLNPLFICTLKLHRQYKLSLNLIFPIGFFRNDAKID